MHNLRGEVRILFRNMPPAALALDPRPRAIPDFPPHIGPRRKQVQKLENQFFLAVIHRNLQADIVG